MDDLMWGLGMMAVGMGAVFTLLLLLMGILLLIGRLDRPHPAHENEKPSPRGQGAGGSAAAPGDADAPAGGDDADTTTAASAGAAASAASSGGDDAARPGAQVLHDGLTADQMTAIALAVITHAHIRRNQAAPEVRTYAPGAHLHASRWVAAGRTSQNAAWRRK